MRVLALGLSVASAVQITDWDKETAGKAVFVKFFAPWCGHCKKMAPAWEQLMTAFEGNPNALVAEVDCTTDSGKPICSANGVQGYPTVKHGDPAAMEDYQGGRDFDSLKAFADENLGPSCGPANLDLCDADQKTKIEEVMALSADDVAAQIKEKEKLIEDAESTFKSELEKLQDQYKTIDEAKETTIKEVKASGLSLLKQVKSFNDKKSKDEL